MFDFIAENISTIIILLILVVIIIFILKYIFKQKKKHHCFGCDNCCDRCRYNKNQTLNDSIQ